MAVDRGEVDVSNFQFKNLTQDVYVVFDQVVLGLVRDYRSLSCFVCMRLWYGWPESGVIERSLDCQKFNSPRVLFHTKSLYKYDFEPNFKNQRVARGGIMGRMKCRANSSALFETYARLRLASTWSQSFLVFLGPRIWRLHQRTRVLEWHEHASLEHHPNVAAQLSSDVHWHDYISWSCACFGWLSEWRGDCVFTWLISMSSRVWEEKGGDFVTQSSRTCVQSDLEH